jgi:hypothetical protein
MSGSKNKVFKISYNNKSEVNPQNGDNGSRVAFVEGATSSAARARLLAFVVDLQDIERATPADLAHALCGALRGDAIRKPIVLMETDNQNNLPSQEETSQEATNQEANPRDDEYLSEHASEFYYETLSSSDTASEHTRY